MKNSYKVVVKSNQGNAKTTTHDVPEPGSWWGALKIKAVPGARYQLIDKTTGQGPDNIRVKRVGNDLRISFEGREDADLVISDYYEQTVPGFGAVIGETEPGVYFAYTPELGQTSALMGNLSDGASNIGMALGGEPVAASGAAVGALVAVAGFNPLLAAPLALLGAGGGGGGDTGGGGVPDTTPPKIRAARLAPEDDTGVSNSDGITADNTPRLLIDADADAVSATVTLNGNPYTSTTKNAQGQFVVQIPDADALGNGQVTYSVVVKDAAGNESDKFSGTPFVVDRLSESLNPAPLINLTKMTQTEFDFYKDDFLTNVPRPDFEGTITNYNAATQKFLVQVVGVTGTTLDYAYITPNTSTGQWTFKPSIDLAGNNDQYLLKATLVDNAGNILKALDQSFGVDRVVPLPQLTYVVSTNSSNVSDHKAGSSESGTFWFGTVNQKFESGTFTLTSALKATGAFKMGFWDLAGNASKTLSNVEDPSTTVVEGWTFDPSVASVEVTQGNVAATYKTPKTFGAGQWVGSVGSYQFALGQETSVNLDGLYQLTPTNNAVAAINHIKMNDGVGNDTLKLTMGDVLALGVKDSFVSNGHRQMRIDGDAGDKVSLDNLVGSSADQTWTQTTTQQLDATNYKVYSNAYWSLDLYIKHDLVML
jgi:hypothetical protein